METITRSGRAVQGFALGDFALGDLGRGAGGGGHGGGGFRGGGWRPGFAPGFRRGWGGGGGGGLPGGWGWWSAPYLPHVEALPVGPCAAWGDPITMPSGMHMAARMALGASGYQPTVARGPDGVLYRFSIEDSEVVVRPCASQVVGTLGDGGCTPGLAHGDGCTPGLAGGECGGCTPGLLGEGGASPAYAAIMTAAAAGLLAHTLRAPLWGSLVAAAGAAMVTHVAIERA